MGLIQTVDQLKFSYMAIAEGARQGNLINSDSPALSAILPSSNKTNISPSHLTRAYTATSRILDSSSSSDSSSDFDYGLGPPPLPPPRSESLLASNSNRQGVPEQRLYQQQVYVNGNDGSGPGLLLPADIAELVEAYNDIPQNLAVVNGNTDTATSETNQDTETNITNTEVKDELFPNAESSMSASPTKYILNNHKLEERKR